MQPDHEDESDHEEQAEDISDSGLIVLALLLAFGLFLWGASGAR